MTSPLLYLTSSPLETDCNTAVNGNDGCGVINTDSSNYGAPFNANGGGWYAVERTDDFIKAWFWPSTSTSVPSGVSEGSSSVDTDNWVCIVMRYTTVKSD
jgi:hypothetical protein